MRDQISNLPLVVQDLIGEFNVEHRSKMKAVLKDIRYFTLDCPYCNVVFKTKNKKSLECDDCSEIIHDLYVSTDRIITFVFIGAISFGFILFKCGSFLLNHK